MFSLTAKLMTATPIKEDKQLHKKFTFDRYHAVLELAAILLNAINNVYFLI